MIQSFKKKMKEQKGFTLIELLAVIVILGILAAIAIPSIIGIIGNTKLDAHVANAQQMVSSARTAVANGEVSMPAATDDTTTTGVDESAPEITLGDLISKGYMESPKDPTDSSGYATATSKVVVKLNTTDSSKLDYFVTLIGNTNGAHITNRESSLLARGIVTK